MTHIFTGEINTEKDWELFETAIDATLTADKVYTIQCINPVYLRWGNDVNGGNYIGSPNIFVEYKYDGETDLYIKTNQKATIIVAES